MPLDTVLCLETSASMGFNNNEGINQLKAAARKFLEGVEETARQANLKDQFVAVAFNNVLDKFFIGVVPSARADLLLVSFIQLFMTEVSKYLYCWPEVPVVGGRTKDQIFCETLTLEKKGKYITFPDIKTTGKRFGPCRDNLFATKRKCYVMHDLQYFCHPLKTDCME